MNLPPGYSFVLPEAVRQDGCEDCMGNRYTRYLHDVEGPRGTKYGSGNSAEQATESAVRQANEEYRLWQLSARERVKKMLDASRNEKRHIYTNDLQTILDGLYEMIVEE